MTDQNSQFFAILTAVGEAKQANADALGVPWTFAQMGVGDANGADPIPDRLQTRLINERRRAPLNTVKVDPGNASIIIAEQVIPPDVGGWWIREIGLYDAAGDLVAVANCAPSFKPLLSQGTGKTQVVRLNLIVTSTANVQLKIDPSVVLATREYVDNKILDVLPPTKTDGVFTQVKIDKRGVVLQGYNPTTLAGYDIRDAYTKTVMDAALVRKADKDKALVVGEVSQQVPVLAANQSGSGYEASAIQIREGGQVGDAQSADGFGPAVGFNWLGKVSGRLFMSAAGLLKWNGKELLTEATSYTQAQINTALNTKADKATTLAGYGINNAYTAPQIDGFLSGKANWGITLGHYGITDTYTATVIDTKFSNKADKATTLAGYGITDTYTAVVIDSTLGNKADKDKALVVGSVSQQVPILAAVQSGLGYDASAIQIREAGQVGNAQSADNYAPAVGFHWLGKTTGRLIMDALGTLKWNGQPLLIGGAATQAEVDNGTGDSNFVTAGKMRFGFYFSKGGGNGNNTIVFPSWLGGLMIQWGVHAANTADTETSVTFPVGFNIIPVCVSMLTHEGPALVQSTVVTQARLLTATGFQSRREDIGTATSFAGSAYIRWLAIGF
ncbi:phage tail protein [Pseudomonas sp. Irchel 3E13]|uniref:phage tail protein n=1 Tax=Pseudomonas sp. Irchel 3E13 TaxID=2008975 RepID=UPI000BA31C52|nr:phage tail protein [Pseudomonas sp. Irchel 3E13]